MVGPPAPKLATVVAVVVASLVAGGLLVRLGPPVTRRTVLATVPWMVVGGVLYALAQVGVYEGPLAATLGSALVVPVLVVLATVLWVPLVQAGRVRTRADPAAYLGATGGAILVPLLVAATVVGQPTVATLVPLLVAPVLAAIATVTVVFVLGLSAAPALAAGRSSALLAVYGQVLHAVSVVVAVDALGAVPAGPLVGVTVGLGEGLVGGFGSAWPYLLVKLCGVALVVVALGRLAERPAATDLAYLLFGAVAALGIGPAVAVLLATTLLA